MESMTLKKGDIIELVIIDFADKDRCFGRLENGMGVMVSGMLAPGDRVRALIRKVKQRFIDAQALQVTEFSSDRVEPPCRYFGVCGGCKLMHVSYEAQLRYKRKKVADDLEHIGGFIGPPVAPVLPAHSTEHYRNKVEFSCSSMRYLLPEEIPLERLERPKDFALGFHAPGNYEKVLDIDYCYLATERMNDLLRLTRQFAVEQGLSPYAVKAHEGFLRNLMLRSSEESGDIMVNIVTSWHDRELMTQYADFLESSLPDERLTVVNNVTAKKNTVATGEQEYTIRGEGSMTERLGSLDFRVSANSFFQTNTRQAEVLYDEIVRVAGLRDNDTVYDLYCGTGTITLYLAKYCRQVVGIEVVESSLRDAARNASGNGIENADFFQADLKDFHSMLLQLSRYESPGVIVTDPPRAGMHPKALDTMIKLGARTIVYVSCNPSNLARDGRELSLNGYRLVSVQPVDMFPHTAHVESVACFERFVQ
ncbi:MAG: 23S rRNA (uracil(1939)-C(5))-methyltransferase RlmD [Chlorobium sp.]|jgi:23S rRNA (uracil1939-C5)-methyltransferase|uniref:23S rRNA (uracil(1939)-C(5))-methyltransferase RlmD n=1 Tax=Chlorobium sp. TaxID=1095 RepID=UPI001D41869B|nr:23S rRNA (uracil(1939)-C(5))-methyltransferase RlmD [Chlorobium sp.]MBN1279042.1 23S rRNA (uracil(1939)-C(5))-methyltransferase RlmD [Chlorobiaceae bacterium]MCF8216321.1 23S rRNA (uracil(1939)-C(5))-methyltransferase RlmD [Chlorobium sp.]MCF8271223.1 23S rRNA (uracil(1939)-C(5))-methyltransferase RlmD [Chlorobium sp.]MCF8287597.1 23S rRNA (uracil(1939)-C(5))-methyltransferase RlmD [Chlorobium sp.]MCF8291136.1 23S rRNA (uracil(1939)-C(5))-methyltransferase RlmD [Chlorobium sp.]